MNCKVMLGQRLVFFFSLVLAACAVASTVAQTQDPQTQSTPFDNDVIVYKSIEGSRREDLKPHYVFPRAGVSSMARTGDKIVIAFQNFDADRNDTANFDRVATAYSTDNGETWSNRKTVVFKSFPSNLQRPFDPTLVEDQGSLRMYFTSSNQAAKRMTTAYHSAVSLDGGETFTYERGSRFAVRGRNIIDSAVGRLQDKWLMIAQVLPQGNNNNRNNGRKMERAHGGPLLNGPGGSLPPCPANQPGQGGQGGFDQQGQFPCIPHEPNGGGGQQQPSNNNNINNGPQISTNPEPVANTLAAKSSMGSGRFTSMGGVRVVGAPVGMRIQLLGSIVQDGEDALFFTGSGNSPLRSRDGNLWRMCDSRLGECVPVLGADPGVVLLGTTESYIPPSGVVPPGHPYNPDDTYFEPPDDNYDCLPDDSNCGDSTSIDGPMSPSGPRAVYLISATLIKNQNQPIG